jgi:hypothetical protein
MNNENVPANLESGGDAFTAFLQNIADHNGEDRCAVQSGRLHSPRS